MRLLVLFLLSFAASAQLSTYDLSCEHLINPIGIDAEAPRLENKFRKT